MKIVLVTIEEPFYAPQYVQKVVEGRGKDITAIVVSSPLMSFSSLRRTLRHQRGIYSLQAFITRSLLFLWVKLLDLVSFSSKSKRSYSVRAVARHYSIPYDTCPNLNDHQFLNDLSELSPDIIVSMGSEQVFRRRILNLPKLGCINVHPSLLPKYRGVAPTFWVLANRESKTGVTVHYMNEKLDDGGIIAQETLEIAHNETLRSLDIKVREVGAKLLLKSLDQIENGTIVVKPNNREEATYFSFPTKNDARKFIKQGGKYR